MGASRLRIVRQLLTESVAARARSAAPPASRWRPRSVRAIQWLQPPGIPRLRDIAVDGQMLLFTLILCVASGVLFGLAPAMGVGRLNLHGTLKDAGRGSAGDDARQSPSPGARRRRARAVGRRAGRRRPARPQLRSPATRGSRVRSARRADARADDDRPEICRRQRRADAPTRTCGVAWMRLPGVAASRRRHLAAAQRLLRVGADHRGRRARRRPASSSSTPTMRVARAAGISRRWTSRSLRGRFFTDQDQPDQPRVVIVDEYMAAANSGRTRIRSANASGSATRDRRRRGRRWSASSGASKQYGLDAGGRIAFYLPHTQSGSRAIVRRGSGAGDPIGAGRARCAKRSTRSIPTCRSTACGR